MQMTNIFRKELNTFSISADNREVLSWFLNAYSKFKAESLDSNLNYKTELCTLSSLYFLNKMLFVFFPVLRLALQVQKQQWMLLFSRSVVSDFLQPHGLQHTRLPCPSPTPGVYPNSCPLSQWCHPTISSSAVPFSSCFQSQHQGLFQWVGSLHQVAKNIGALLHHQSFQWIFKVDFP